ncbi:YmfQ family protein [Falsiroseomonas sp.]|uniref:YmfQ family protein n=1 Tax=Falsiroseomonas sp. TaxID=2870721 RepID=UPI003F702C25
MADVELGQAEHLAVLQALMPTGPVWPRHPGTTQEKVLAGLAAGAARLRARARALLTDAFPATAFELLPDWEAALGLPDPCAGPSPGLQERRGQVVARLTARGGQSIPYLVSQAAALGYAITIREFGPSRLGAMRLGGHLQDERWAHAWAVQAPLTTVTPFRLGQSTLGERFAAWGNAVLECEMRVLAPLHTTLIFQYG